MLFSLSQENTIHEQEPIESKEMEGLQLEILVMLLYVSLIYEIIIGFRRRGQQTFEKMGKVSVGTRKPCRRVTSARTSVRVGSENPHQTYRHFVQMRILTRD